MNSELNTNSTESASADSSDSRKATGRMSRRALLRAGAAATPVLLTVASGPVSATNTVGCVVASSFISVATFLSRNPGKTVACATFDCEHWRAQSAPAVVATLPADHALNGTVAALLGTTGSSYNGDLVKNVMLEGSGITTAGPLGVLQHCLAMALNTQYAGLVNPGALNLTYMQGVWQSYNTNHPNYVSPSGVVMSEAQLIAWLRVLMYPLELP